MVALSRTAVLVATVACTATGAESQEEAWAAGAYRSAVARFFELPEAEIAILGNWDLPPDEIPVVLFLARRAGVSAEALVAFRESGRSWPELARRYRIGADALYLPLRNAASAGALSPVYERFRETPVPNWDEIPLTGPDIVALVNVRVLSQSLGLSPDEIMRHTGTAGSFVELYARLIR